MTRSSSLVVLLVLGAGPLLAQDNAPAVANLSLDQLNSLRVKIASVIDKPVREQPGIVSVITEQDIAESGATDLMEILALVPGFSFASDIAGIVGTGFRGIWGYEGKILLMVDGIAVNDGLFGNILVQRHYAADQIQQVEIIRGPGSARYGGSAELAVISITTKGAGQNGGRVSVRPEVSSGQAGVAVSGSAGYTSGDWRASLGINYEHFANFEGPWVSLKGDRLDLTGMSNATPSAINAAVGWKALDVRAIYDNYSTPNPLGPGHDGLLAPTWGVSWQSFMTAVSYELKPAAWLTVSPKVTVEHGEPWRITADAGFEILQIEHQKTSVDVPGIVTVNDRNHVAVGMTAYRESATALQLDAAFGYPPPSLYFAGSNQVHYNDAAVYAQYDLDTAWANVTIGGRYEHHSYAGGAFVPRIGVTKAWDAFHVKLLYDRAFRTPNIGDINQRLSGAPVTYEETSGYQIEAGYRLSDHFSAIGNLYYMQVDMPIAFTIASVTQHGYENGSTISTHGAEFEARYAAARVAGALGYAYYQADQQLSESLGLYGSSVAGVNLGLPSHKASFSGTYHASAHIDWNVNGVLNGPRRTFSYPGPEGWLSPELNVNTRVEYRTGPVSIAASLRNLFNESIVVTQAYNGRGAPLPLLGRNAAITLTYHF
jgi:outer membrane receptor protein involved in Fe transport